ncbi:MAG: leucyl aminopeptidase family protein [Xanthomonadales bacterium]|nr:leucyl aminopeptidase family protein [Xanthomonadales bacterium]
MTRLVPADSSAIPIQIVSREGFNDWQAAQPEPVRNWARVQRFEGAPGQTLCLPGDKGELVQVVVGATPASPLWTLALLPDSLPAGCYRLAEDIDAAQLELLLLGFLIGGYRFTRYSGKAPEGVTLAVSDQSLLKRVSDIAAAWSLARDLVNTPTEDLGPAELAEVAAAVAKRHDATIRVVVGQALLEQNFPAIHAVGRASHRAPRLIELDWGDPGDPAVTLVGKGVCFDTGGLNIKGGEGMALMKKDMGGAAVALGLAQLVMAQRLPVRLKLLIPAVENALGPDSYRPGEVINTRPGLRVEIGNTDAEGRLILGDALSYAGEQRPELLLDFATLTGAARVALGADLPALFSDDDGLADGLLAGGRAVGDPLWRMPLWDDYLLDLSSAIADLNNAGSSRMGGAITAALYLKRFVPAGLPWAHVDTYCWNPKARPGRPPGGEAQSLRAAFSYLEWRYSEQPEQRR